MGKRIGPPNDAFAQKLAAYNKRVEQEVAKAYRWSSVEFSERLPKVWIRPKGSKAGEPTGIVLTFGSVAEFAELVSTLSGALSVIREGKR